MGKNKYDRTCSICGDHYDYCSRNCQEYAHLPKWMNTYCSKTCMDLYDICAGYTFDWFDKKVMAAKLMTVNYKDKYEKLPEWMKKAISEMEKFDNSNAAAINEAIAKSDVTEDNPKTDGPKEAPSVKLEKDLSKSNSTTFKKNKVEKKDKYIVNYKNKSNDN